MLVIGLTGGIGSGKTTVANMFAELGVDIIDTDVIARELVEPGSPTLKQIVDHFGDDILKKDGQLNRQRLADITFKNKLERKTLEAILHPVIRKNMLDRLNTVKAPYCVAVIPLLFETNQIELVDRILVIDCKQEDQLQRVKKRDQRDQEQILSIINSQASRDTRLNAADDTIENSGDINGLHEKVAELHKKYLKLGA